MVTSDFPYVSKTFDARGLRMAYVDEGRGAPMLMVHGNPTWSFYWRKLISAARGTHRCIAPDHIGCGRSEKPSRSDYPHTLARRVDDLEALVNHLDLRDVTLVVHDWGGAIGLGWATRNPERVARIVVLNTGAFHLPAGKSFPAALSLARVPGLGALLIQGGHAFARGANRFCVTRRSLPKAVAHAYLAPYPRWRDRLALLRFVEDIPLNPGDQAYPVIDELANNLHKLTSRPMLILWGMRDFVFDHHFLAEWERRFSHARVRRFNDCGHYLMEDAGEEVVAEVMHFTGPAAPAALEVSA